MKKFSWGSLLTAIGLGALATVTPVVQTAVSSHPVATTILATIWTVIGHFLPSPTATPGA